MNEAGDRIDEGARRAFERARASGQVDLERFLPAGEDERHLATLEELVAIDLEFAWREVTETGEPPLLDEYVGRFPSLGAPAIHARLLQEAEHLRKRFGSRSDELRPQPRLESKRDEIGESIGHYRLLEEAGRGAFARVYRAWDSTLDRHVALKILRREFDDDPGVRARMEREAKSAAQMHHPGIVPIHEVGEVGGRPYLVTEFVEGQSLEERLRESPPTPERAAEWVSAIADALHYAHQLGIVHRDVKPANVLLDEDGTPKLTDFGLAVIVEADSELTRDGDLLGTPAYMAPEQIRDPDGADSRSDVYSLGVLLFRALAGRLPFEGGWSKILQDKRTEDSPRLREVRPELPRDLDAICSTAMARERDRRYASAAALAADLRRWVARERIQARPIGAFEQLGLWARRNPKVVLTAAVGALLVATVASIGIGAVLDERDRFRGERDVAQANLYRSLIGEARAKLELRDSGWWWSGMDKVVEASRLGTESRDAKELRELAIEFLGAEDPCFRLRHEASIHSGDVLAVAVDRSGTRVASGGADGRFVVRRSADGEELFSTQLDSVVEAVGFTTAGALCGTASGEILFVRQESHELTRVACDNGGVRALASRSDVPYFVVGGADGTIRMYEGEDLAVTTTFGSGEPVVDVALSPSGDLVGVARADQSLEFWDRSSQLLLGRTGTIDEIRSIVFWDEHRMLANEPASFGARLHDVRNLDKRRESDFTTESHTRDMVCSGGWTIVSEHNGSIHALDRRFDQRAIGRSDFKSALSLAADERALVVAVGHASGVVRTWELTQPPNRWFIGDSHFVSFARNGAVQLDGRRTELLGDGLIKSRVYSAAPNRRIAAHPMGFVTGARDGRLTLFDTDWRVVASVSGDGAEVEHLAVDEQRGTIATGSAGGTARIYSSDLSRSSSVEVHGPQLKALAFLSDGTLYVQGRAARFVSVSGAVLGEFPDLEASCGMAVDDELVVGTESGDLERWSNDEGTWRRTRSLRAFASEIVSLAYAPGAKLLVAESADRELIGWDLESDRASLRISERLKVLGPPGIAVDKEARWLMHYGTSTVWNLERRQPFLWLETSTAGSSVFDQGGLFSVTGTGGVLRIDVEGFATAQAEIPELKRAWPIRVRRWEQVVGGGHSLKIWGRAETQDGRLSSTCSHDGAVKLWRNLDQPELVWTRDEGRGDIAWAVAFDSSGDLLASSSLDVSVWDVATGARLRRFDGHERLVTGVAFFRARPWLASCSFDGSVRVWDWSTGERVGELLEGDDAVHQLKCDASGRWLAAACRDGTVRLWDCEALAKDSQATLADCVERVLPSASRSPIWGLAFDGDSARVAGADEVGDVTLWGVPDGRELVTLRSDAVRLRDLAFDRQGTKLASGCYVSKGIVWDLAGIRETLADLGLEPW